MINKQRVQSSTALRKMMTQERKRIIKSAMRSSKRNTTGTSLKGNSGYFEHQTSCPLRQISPVRTTEVKKAMTCQPSHKKNQPYRNWHSKQAPLVAGMEYQNNFNKSESNLENFEVLQNWQNSPTRVVSGIKMLENAEQIFR